MAKARKKNPNAFRLADNPKDKLYKRCADSLCFECNDTIGEEPFELVFSEYRGADLLVHERCADKVDHEVNES